MSGFSPFRSETNLDHDGGATCTCTGVGICKGLAGDTRILHLGIPGGGCTCGLVMTLIFELILVLGAHSKDCSGHTDFAIAQHDTVAAMLLDGFILFGMCKDASQCGSIGIGRSGTVTGRGILIPLRGYKDPSWQFSNRRCKSLV